MAGNYMDAPNDRLAWDRDGSILTYITPSGEVYAQPSSTRRAVNAETETSAQFPISTAQVAVVFPIPTDCSAVFIATADPVTDGVLYSSKDTTNGLDGTWTLQTYSPVVTQVVVKPYYRVSNRLVRLLPNSTSSDLRGIRFQKSAGNLTNGLRALHIYGQPSPGATKDRLALWRPDTDAKLPPTWFDWGNVPRSTSADRQFRVKNLSSDLIAGDIDVYVEALTPGDPGVDNMHTISDNGGATFLSSLVLPDLAPGEISDVLTLRRVVPENALVSTWSARIAADVNEWKVQP